MFWCILCSADIRFLSRLFISSHLLCHPISLFISSHNPHPRTDRNHRQVSLASHSSEETFVVSESPQKWLANKNIPDTYHQSFLIIPPSNSFYYVCAYVPLDVTATGMFRGYIVVRGLHLWPHHFSFTVSFYSGCDAFLYYVLIRVYLLLLYLIYFMEAQLYERNVHNTALDLVELPWHSVTVSSFPLIHFISRGFASMPFGDILINRVVCWPFIYSDYCVYEIM